MTPLGRDESLTLLRFVEETCRPRHRLITQGKHLDPGQCVITGPTARSSGPVGVLDGEGSEGDGRGTLLHIILWMSSKSLSRGRILFITRVRNCSLFLTLIKESFTSSFVTLHTLL